MYIWNSKKSVLSFNGSTLKHGDAIPDDYPEESLEVLIQKGKIVKGKASPKVFAPKPPSLEDLQKIVDGLFETILTIGQEIVDMPDDASAAKKNGAEKRLNNAKTNLVKAEAELKAAGGE